MLLLRITRVQNNGIYLPRDLWSSGLIKNKVTEFGFLDCKNINYSFMLPTSNVSTYVITHSVRGVYYAKYGAVVLMGGFHVKNIKAFGGGGLRAYEK